MAEAGAWEMVVFLFLVVALVVVVGAVTLAVVGGGDGAVLADAAPERWSQPPPWDRPLDRADVEALRFPTALRGYRMSDVDDALGRLGAELAERDARIAALESAVPHTAVPPSEPSGGPGGYGGYGYDYGTTDPGAQEYGAPEYGSAPEYGYGAPEYGTPERGAPEYGPRRMPHGPGEAR